MAETYVTLDEPALVDGVECEAGAIVAIDDTIAADFGSTLAQDHVGWTAAQWTSGNPTMVANHFGIESDTGLSKLGDGVTAWNSLDYAPTTFTVDDTPDITSNFAAYATATPTTSDTIVINDTSDSSNPKVVTLTALKTLMNA